MVAMLVVESIKLLIKKQITVQNQIRPDGIYVGLTLQLSVSFYVLFLLVL